MNSKAARVIIEVLTYWACRTFKLSPDSLPWPAVLRELIRRNRQAGMSRHDAQISAKTMIINKILAEHSTASRSACVVSFDDALAGICANERVTTITCPECETPMAISGAISLARPPRIVVSCQNCTYTGTLPITVFTDLPAPSRN